MEPAEPEGGDGTDETQPEEEEEIPPFEDELVEIQGLADEVSVEGGPPTLVGSTVQGNGRRGRAQWDKSRRLYVVHTFDGLCLPVPEENLKEHEPVEPEDGGFDIAWPLAAGSHGFFGTRVVKMLRRKGFCVVQMFQSDEMRENMLEAAADEEKTDYTLPFQEFVDAYLGQGARSKVSFVKSTKATAPRNTNWEDPLGHYCQLVKDMLHILAPALESKLGIQAWPECKGTLLRKPLASEEELDDLSYNLQEEDIKEGKVEQHLDFIQNRRLCAMYVVESDGGTLELYPRADLGLDTIRLQTSRDKLIVFRHDLMQYSYEASSASDLVIQSWFMEEPPALELTSFNGSSHRSIERIFGGPQQTPDRQVHVTAMTTNFPGNSKYIPAAWCMNHAQTDCLTKIPASRWDMDMYYDFARGAAKSGTAADGVAAVGKSATKHTGFIREEEWILFDAAFFGIEKDVAFRIAPCERLMLHTVYDLLNFSGYPDMKSMRGREIDCYTATTGVDWDLFENYENPAYTKESWLHGQNGGWGTQFANRVMYSFGLRGLASNVDTACSGAMVAGNCNFASLRKADTRGVYEGMVLSSQNILTPWPYIGMSMAGMVGPQGRCLTFDMGASGFSRGEGAGGFMCKVSNNVQVTADRLGVYCGGFTNQDGRSASLTAPNGPSQVLCMRGSLRDGMIDPENCVYMETHGTGTALGDPIEVGSCRTTFRQRETCIPITTGKSHTGHLEATAGLINVVKIIQSITHSTVCPNVHLNFLNPHIEDGGFPAAFLTEKFCMNDSFNTVATNAFGFGGTNSHADFFGRSRFGSYKQVGRTLNFKELEWVSVACGKCGQSMCWRCGLAMRPGNHIPGQKHYCRDIRAEFARYDYCSDCYERDYQYGGDFSVNGHYMNALQDTTLYGPEARDAEWYHVPRTLDDLDEL